MVIIMVVTMIIVGKSKGKVQWPKKLETIIIEAAFFSLWGFLHEHSRFIVQQCKGEAISLAPHRGQIFSGKEFIGRLFYMEGILIISR